MWLITIINLVTINCVLCMYVGDKCSPSEDIPYGICTILTECEVADSMVRKHGQHKYARCGFVGEMEIVCCPKITSKFGRINELPQTSLRIADRECQNFKSGCFSMRPNIINGEVAVRGEFPHMVALGVPIYNGYDFKCGGTLISSMFVITAAHCIKNKQQVTPTIVRVGVAVLGKSDWNEESDYRIAESIIHPKYLTREFYHDLALIRLEKPVQFDCNQAPACLYTSSEDPKSMLTVLGWGTTNYSSTTTTDTSSNLLMKAELAVVPRHRCSQKYFRSRKLPRLISDDLICATDPKGVSDTCKGDSGGPLLDTSQTDGMNRIVGVTSFGSDCANVAPGVYVRISRYLDWIESVVWSDSQLGTSISGHNPQTSNTNPL